MTRFFVYISCSHHGPHSQTNTEPFSVMAFVQLSKFRLFLPANYTTHKICCHVHVLPMRASWFWRCGQFFPSLLTAYWVLSAYFLAVLKISVCAYFTVCTVGASSTLNFSADSQTATNRRWK